MRRNRWPYLVLSLSLVALSACNGGDEEPDADDAGAADVADAVDVDPGPQTVDIDHAFGAGEGGWESDVSDFAIGADSAVAFRGEVRSLPAELNETGGAYYLDALNPSADVFAFIRKQLTADDGLYPSTDYQVTWRIRFATNLAETCATTPGRQMFLKAGATTFKPAVIDREERRELNYDKGDGRLGGPAATVLGDIAHDGDCEGTDRENFVPQVLERTHSTVVRSAEDASLWLLAGVDTDVSHPLVIFIIRVEATLEPVDL